MRSRLVLAAIAVLVFAGSFLAKALLSGSGGGASPPPQYRRIVSLAPSVTETLFALGQGDRVVGVTRYCRFPPEAATRRKVGGFLDPNFEALLALKPDLIVMLQSNESSQPALEKLGLNCLVVCHKNVAGILSSFTEIGNALGAEAKAAELVADARRRIRRIEQKTAGRDRPRVLCSVLRNPGAGRLDGVTVAAADGYFDKIIAIAGGENACRQAAAPFPQVSHEGILWMDPQVIVDLVRPVSQLNVDRKTILADWREVAEVEAVRTGRVYVIDDDFAPVPGPRFILLVEKLARLLHPEVDWE